ncbi:WXG100 family type VII secretion target [Streptomyces prunicolor]|uniref:Uncharacterized protein n=1 Tax=Streptomyces prunicolor TaxID=67348 RepID=A0ABU4FHQ3_9ACTN|nr:hypothetical protein [Streptomyces prunicolor]MDV7219501.1 hypothetical protein [Streptomyces prunicolor]
MGDEQKQPNPHQAEKSQVAQQVGVIDAASTISNIFGGGNVRCFGTTDFENHRLNDMIDMVETASPEHLENAGTALWEARDAISDAAEELRGHIDNVDWEGDSGQAFRDWGSDLVTYAVNLASFAEVAGTQISAAATGLASVRIAMPPRDTRFNTSQTPSDIPLPARVSGNGEYTEAVKVEKDRQEAINQMNRLSSFYTVSEGVLAAQEPPTFLQAMPDVGVPRPKPSISDPYLPIEKRDDQSLGGVQEPAATRHHASSVVTHHPSSVDTTQTVRHPDDSRVHPDVNVGTKIDGVGTLPSQEITKPATNLPPTMPASGGGNGGMIPPLVSGAVPPAFGTSTGRTSGFGGATGSRSPISAQGRAVSPGGTTGGRGNTGPMGRAAATGQSGIRSGETAAGRSPLGRAVSGGTPRPVGGPAGGRAGGPTSTGAARGNGVVGGKPTTGAAPGANGPRVPRGTVVGAEGNSNSRTPTGKIGQRGVIGAPKSAPGARPGQSGRPAVGNPDGVVGTPQSRPSTVRGAGGTGGAPGVPRGSAGSRHSRNREDREGEREQDAQRRNTPPVTD